MALHKYSTLAFGEGYLKNFTNNMDNPVLDDPPFEDGNIRTFNQDDLDQAQDRAFHEINARLVNCYDVSDWEGATPAIIVHVADLLGAGYAWLQKFASDLGQADANAVPLLEQGRRLLNELRSGTMFIIQSDGSVQARRALQSSYDLG
mgnify:CR=1 FL=1